MLASLLHRDAPIRLVGIGLLIIGSTCLLLLFGNHIGPTNLAGEAAAALGFLGCSIGLMLTFLGAHIHDPVFVPRPWGVQDAPQRALPVRAAICGSQQPPTGEFNMA